MATSCYRGRLQRVRREIEKPLGAEPRLFFKGGPKRQACERSRGSRPGRFSQRAIQSRRNRARFAETAWFVARSRPVATVLVFFAVSPTELPPLSHLFLAGYRGTGKSSIASLLAQRLAIPAVDLDAAIQQRAGRTIAEIFAGSGEEEFRRLESQTLRELAGQPAAHVVALGGGAVLREENRRVIRDSGRCVRLTAAVETIAARIAGDGATAAQRPPLTRLGQIEEIRQLLELRREAYEAAADWTVDTEGKSLADVAEEIGRWWVAADAGEPGG